jgi:predicted nucleic acid-binding protein
MNIFFDSSAWAKRYIIENGSDQVVELCLQAETVTLSILCLPEVISAFARLRREGKLDESQFSQLKSAFLQDIRDAKMINLTPYVIKHSLELLEQNSLRTLDALQISCAINGKTDLFASADVRQLRAAENYGMKIIKV